MKENVRSGGAIDQKTANLIAFGVVCIGMIIFCWNYVDLALTRHQTFNSTGYDLAIMEQIVWNTAQGDFFASSLEVDNSFADHFRPMLGLLVPFYLLYPRPEFLLVFQVVGLALGAIPTFLLAWEKLKSVWLGLALGLVYLLTPALGFILRFDFHIEFLAVPAFIAAIYSIHMRSWRWASFWLLIPLLCKENMGLSVAAVGVWMLILEWQVIRARFPRYVTNDPELTPLKFATAWITIGLATFVITSFVIIPAMRGEASDSLGRYAWFFEEAGTPLLNVIDFLQTPPRIDTMIQLFGPTGFLAVLALPELAMLAPGLAQNLLADHFCQPTIYCHYTTPVIPFLIVAAIYALARLNRLAGGHLISTIGAICMLLASIYFLQQENAFTYAGLLPGWEEGPGNQAVVEQALAAVPASGSLVTTNDYAPHLAQRRELYVIGLPSQREAPTDPDILFLNLYDQQYIICDQIKSYIDQMEPDRYGTLFRTGGLIVIARDQGDREQYLDFRNNWNNCAG